MSELIPAPVTVRDVSSAGGFVFDENTVIDAGPGTGATARWLRGALGAATGLVLPPGVGDDGETVRLRVQPEDAGHLGPEGYKLYVNGDDIVIHGGGPAGVFWGAQTLRQLLGPDAFRRAPVAPGRQWLVPAHSSKTAPDSAGAASCSTWPGTSCRRTASCVTWT